MAESRMLTCSFTGHDFPWTPGNVGGRPPAACAEHKEAHRRARTTAYKQRYRDAKREIEAAAAEKMSNDRINALVQARLRALLDAAQREGAA